MQAYKRTMPSYLSFDQFLWGYPLISLISFGRDRKQPQNKSHENYHDSPSIKIIKIIKILKT